MSTASRYDEVISLPRAVRFPVEMIPPARFDPGKLETWPSVVGRLEYIDGRLLYLPPCGDFQQDTVTDVVITLGEWVRKHQEFVLGANEAGCVSGEQPEPPTLQCGGEQISAPITGGCAGFLRFSQSRSRERTKETPRPI